MLKKANLMKLRALFFLFPFLFFMGEVNIASVNINGARDIRKRAILYEVFKQKKIDIIFLQETHSDIKNAVEWT